MIYDNIYSVNRTVCYYYLLWSEHVKIMQKKKMFQCNLIMTRIILNFGCGRSIINTLYPLFSERYHNRSKTKPKQKKSTEKSLWFMNWFKTGIWENIGVQDILELNYHIDFFLIQFLIEKLIWYFNSIFSWIFLAVSILKSNMELKEIFQHFDETNLNGRVVDKLDEVLGLVGASFCRIFLWDKGLVLFQLVILLYPG